MDGFFNRLLGLVIFRTEEYCSDIFCTVGAECDEHEVF
jgi:hypothetical protein